MMSEEVVHPVTPPPGDFVHVFTNGYGVSGRVAGLLMSVEPGFSCEARQGARCDGHRVSACSPPPRSEVGAQHLGRAVRAVAGAGHGNQQ